MKRRPDRPKRVRQGDSDGGGGLSAWARKKNEKYSELRDGRHREQGQERELCPILHLVGEALHCSTPPTPKRPKQKKETHRQRAKKVVWRGVGVAGDSKKTTDTRLVVDL